MTISYWWWSIQLCVISLVFLLVYADNANAIVTSNFTYAFMRIAYFAFADPFLSKKKTLLSWGSFRSYLGTREMRETMTTLAGSKPRHANRRASPRMQAAFNQHPAKGPEYIIANPHVNYGLLERLLRVSLSHRIHWHLCVEKINDCAPSNPCPNGGSRIDGISNCCTCSCPPGFLSCNCSEGIDECTVLRFCVMDLSKHHRYRNYSLNWFQIVPGRLKCNDINRVATVLLPTGIFGQQLKFDLWFFHFSLLSEPR